MPDAGQIWERGLSNFGESIGSAIAEVGKRHQQQENLFGKAAELHEMGVIPDKEWNPIAEMHKRHQAINQGRLEALTAVYGAAALAGAKAVYQTDKFQQNQNVIEAREKRIIDYKAAHKQSKSQIDVAANKFAAGLGLTPDEFQQVEPDKIQMMDQFGSPIDPKNKLLPPAFGVGEVNGKKFRVPFKDMDKFKNLISESKKSQQPEQGTDIPVVNTPEEASKLEPGTIFQTPQGKRFRVPMKRKVASSAPVSTGDDSEESDDENGE